MTANQKQQLSIDDDDAHTTRLSAEISGFLSVAIGPDTLVTPAVLVVMSRLVDRAVMNHRCNVGCPYISTLQKPWCFHDTDLIAYWTRCRKTKMPACPQLCFAEAALSFLLELTNTMSCVTPTSTIDLVALKRVLPPLEADEDFLYRDIHLPGTDEYRMQECLMSIGLPHVDAARVSEQMGRSYIKAQRSVASSTTTTAWYHDVKQVEQHARAYAIQKPRWIDTQLLLQVDKAILLRHAGHVYCGCRGSRQWQLFDKNSKSHKPNKLVRFMLRLAQAHKADANTSPLYEANHPWRVRAYFTARLLEQAMIETQVYAPLPLDLLRLVGEYEPAHLPLFLADAQTLPSPPPPSPPSPITARFDFTTRPVSALPHHQAFMHGIDSRDVEQVMAYSKFQIYRIDAIYALRAYSNINTAIDSFWQ